MHALPSIISDALLWFKQPIWYNFFQVMQNQHIASVTLYQPKVKGKPEPSWWQYHVRIGHQDNYHRKRFTLELKRQWRWQRERDISYLWDVISWIAGWRIFLCDMLNIYSCNVYTYVEERGIFYCCNIFFKFIGKLIFIKFLFLNIL